MSTRTHFLALPFHNSDDGTIAIPGHLIECVSEAEAVKRAEQMATYPEYVGAIAFALRRRNGRPYGSVVLKASFGVFKADMVYISRLLD